MQYREHAGDKTGMKYSSYITVESKVCAGVSFTYRKMTVRRRDALEEMQAPVRARMKKIQDEMAPLSKRYREAVDQAKATVKPERERLMAEGKSREEAEQLVALPALGMPDEDLRNLLELSAAITKIDRKELTPAAVEFALVSIAGLEIDDAAATLEMLLECGPDELYREIAEAVAHELGLLPEERENLQSPSTSGAAVDGGTIAGTAGDAGTPATTISADAPSSTDRESAVVSITSVGR